MTRGSKNSFASPSTKSKMLEIVHYPLPRSRYAVTSCLTALVMAMGSSGAVHANPVDGTVAAGSATIGESGATLTVNQSSDKAVIDWRGFDIGASETTRFNQPSSSSITLNRVNSNSASHIDGNLTANGNILVINQNGVVFGAGARVDVNGLVVSTADTDNHDFMNGNGKVHLTKPGNPDAEIVNAGTISAKEAGLVGLVAPRVTNSGVITARMGHVGLASGDTATVDFYGDGLMEVALSDQVTKSLVSNTGKIKADGGTIAMTAASGRSIVDSLIANSGLLRAQSVSTKNGVIIIANAASNGRVMHAGRIDARGRRGTGGSVTLLADNVTLKSGSKIDVSGKIGGGSIYVGGAAHGANAASNAIGRNAQYTIVEAGATLTANAAVQGNGGNVVVWGDDTTVFAGDISAKGGILGGNGGFAETSGKKNLAVTGSVNLRALSESTGGGKTGTWLLDPANITIYGSGTAGTDSVNSFTVSYLETASATADINLVANNNLTLDMNNSGSTDSSLDAAAGRSIILTATSGNITSNSTGTLHTTGAGVITLTAGGTINLGTNAVTLNSGGNVTLSSVGNMTLGAITTSAGKTVSATVSGVGNAITTNGTIATGANGNITLISDDLNVNSDLSGTGILAMHTYGASNVLRVNFYSGDWSIDQSEINHFVDGWSSIVIGRADNTDGIYIGSSTFTDPVTFLNSYGIYENTATDTLTGTGNASFRFTGNNGWLYLYGSIVTAGGSVTADYTTYLPAASSIATHGGNITLPALSIGDAYSLNSGGGAIAINGTITDWGGSSGKLFTVNAGGGAVSFGDTVDGPFNLSVTGVGITTNGAWGNSDSLGNVTLASTNTPTLGAIKTISGKTVSINITGAGQNLAVGSINTGTGGSLYLSALGAITQTAALNVSNLYLGGASGAYTLTNSSNNIGTLAANTGSINLANGNHGLTVGTVNSVSGVTTSGDFAVNTGTGTFTNNQAVTVGSGHALTIDADDAAVNAALTGPGGTLTLETVSSGRPIYINFGITDNTNLNLVSAEISRFTDGWGNIVIGGASNGYIKANAMSWTDPVTFRTGGFEDYQTITGTGNASFHFTQAPTLYDTVSTAGGAITIDGTGFAGGDVHLTSNGGNISLYDLVIYNGNGNWIVNSGGGSIGVTSKIEQSGTSAAGKTVSLTSGAGTITLGGAIDGAFDFIVNGATINNSSAWGGSTALGNVTLTSVNSFTLPSITASSITARVTGVGSDITLGGNLSASATSGTTIALVSADDFFNSGNYTLTTAGTGRWLIYSQQPTDNNLGGLSGSFNRYSCAFNTVGTCAANATLGTTVAIPGSGNGLIYSYTPTVTATASSISALTYGDAAPNLTGYAYTVSGYLTGEGADTVTGTLTGTTAYAPGSNIGTYDITYSAGTLSSALGYQINYASNATAFIVNPRTITASLTGTVEKSYDGLSSATLANNNYALSTLYGTDDVYISHASGTYNTANAGSGKLVSVTGLALSGTKAGNYVLASTSASGNVGLVDQKSLVIQVADAVRLAGEANPAFTVSYNGFITGEDASVVSGLNVATSANSSSAAGMYQIVGSGAYAQNYAISYVSGTLTVQAKAVAPVATVVPNTVQVVSQNPWITALTTTYDTAMLAPPQGLMSIGSSPMKASGQFVNAQGNNTSSAQASFYMLLIDPRVANRFDLDNSVEF